MNTTMQGLFYILCYMNFIFSWCNPCKVLDPTLREAVGEFEGELDVAKVDIDLLPEVAMTYDVSSIPAVLGFVDGVKKCGFVGAVDHKTITDFLKELDKK